MSITDAYFGISWIAVLLSLLLLIIGIWNCDLWPSEKGFYGILFSDCGSKEF